ncbi:hypothetical protein LINPERPRIM_LOCUS27935, partial [Linum perenne]
IQATLNYWLVDHPQILHFTWSPGQTFASSPQFLAVAVISYLILTLLLRCVPFPPLPPSLLKPSPPPTASSSSSSPPSCPPVASSPFSHHTRAASATLSAPPPPRPPPLPARSSFGPTFSTSPNT